MFKVKLRNFALGSLCLATLSFAALKYGNALDEFVAIPPSQEQEEAAKQADDSVVERCDSDDCGTKLKFTTFESEARECALETLHTQHPEIQEKYDRVKSQTDIEMVIQTAFHDINGDALEDVFVFIQSPVNCGRWGCTFHLMEQQKTEDGTCHFKILEIANIVQNDIRVLKKEIHGKSAIQFGSKENAAIWTWNEDNQAYGLCSICFHPENKNLKKPEPDFKGPDPFQEKSNP